MIYRTISAGKVIAKIYRDLGNTIQIADWEQDAFEWVGEALEHIGAGVQLTKKNDVLEISSFKAILPSDLVQLIDVFYAPSVTTDTVTGQSFECTVSGDNLSAPPLDNIVTLVINGTSYSEILDTDNATTAANWVTTHGATLLALGITATSVGDVITLEVEDPLADATVVDGSQIMNVMVVETAAVTGIPDAVKYPLNRSGASIHAGVHTQIRGESPGFVGESYVLNPDYIHVSYETGYISISYLGFPLDANGYPLVPDDISYKEAMFWYILKKLMMRGWVHPGGFNYQFAEANWQRYCTQARNAANMPDIGQYDQFLRSWRRLVMPPTSREQFFDEDDLRNPNWSYGLSEYE